MKFRVKKKRNHIQEKRSMRVINSITPLINKHQYTMDAIEKFIDDVLYKRYAMLSFVIDIEEYKYVEGVEKLTIISMSEKDVRGIFGGKRNQSSFLIYDTSKEGKLNTPPVAFIIWEDFDLMTPKRELIKFVIYHEIGHVICIADGLLDTYTLIEHEVFADYYAVVNLNITDEEGAIMLNELKKLSFGIDDPCLITLDQRIQAMRYVEE